LAGIWTWPRVEPPVLLFCSLLHTSCETMIYLKCVGKIHRGNIDYHGLIWNERCKIVHKGILYGQHIKVTGSFHANMLM
jgi:hypothetical protein